MSALSCRSECFRTCSSVKDHEGYSSSSRLAAAPNLQQRTRSLFVRWVLKRGFVFESVRLRHCLARKSSVAGVDATNERRLLFTRAFETEIGEQFHVT